MSVPPRKWWWPLLMMIAITLASGQSQPFVPGPTFALKDKLLHFAVFGALATAWVRCRPVSLRWTGVALALTVGFGLADEFRQRLTPGRLFEWNDFLADTLGAAVAVTFWTRWTRWRTVLEGKFLPGKRPLAARVAAPADLP